MSVSIPSHANHVMLRWARETANLSVEEVAAAEKIESNTIRQWENGEGSPTLAVLRKLSGRYKRPLQVFYLPQPQQGFTIVKDLRTIGGTVNRDFPSDLKIAIRKCQERQAWASEYLQELGFEPVDYLGSLSINASPENSAKKLRDRLGVNIDEVESESSDPRERLWMWRDAIERTGVFVWQVSKIDVTEMRGFALLDKYAPVIAINAQDSYTARLFSLIHELGHLLLGQTALSDAAVGQKIPDQSKIERFCNRLAAETLMPTDDFRRCIPANWRSLADSVIGDLAKRYGVSPEAVLIRLVELDYADQKYADSKRKKFDKPGQQSGGPKQWIKMIANNGKSFSRLVISAYEGETVHGGQLTDLLGMKLKHLAQASHRLYPLKAS